MFALMLSFGGTVSLRSAFLQGAWKVLESGRLSKKDWTGLRTPVKTKVLGESSIFQGAAGGGGKLKLMGNMSRRILQSTSCRSLVCSALNEPDANCFNAFDSPLSLL